MPSQLPACGAFEIAPPVTPTRPPIVQEPDSPADVSAIQAQDELMTPAHLTRVPSPSVLQQQHVGYGPSFVQHNVNVQNPSALPNNPTAEQLRALEQRLAQDEMRLDQGQHILGQVAQTENASTAQISQIQNVVQQQHDELAQQHQDIARQYEHLEVYRQAGSSLEVKIGENTAVAQTADRNAQVAIEKVKELERTVELLQIMRNGWARSFTLFKTSAPSTNAQGRITTTSSRHSSRSSMSSRGGLTSLSRITTPSAPLWQSNRTRSTRSEMSLPIVLLARRRESMNSHSRSSAPMSTPRNILDRMLDQDRHQRSRHGAGAKSPFTVGDQGISMRGPG